MTTEKRRISFVRALKFLNIILVTLPFVAYAFSRMLNITTFSEETAVSWILVLIFVGLYMWAARTYDAFYISYSRISELFYSQSLSILVADGFMFLILWLLLRRIPPFLPALLTFAIQLLVSGIWCISVQKWYFTIFPPAKAFVVWDQRKDLLDLVNSADWLKRYRVIGECRSDSCLEDLSVLGGVETVFMSGIRSHERNIIMKYCVEHEIPAFVIPRLGDLIMSSSKKIHMFHLPILQVSRYNPSPEYLFAKRFLDIVISLIGLVVTAPIMLVTSIAIKAYDNGPIFYKQKRLTKDGKIFEVLKFRSMRVDAEKDGKARLSSGATDQRITPVGRIIRGCRIDELPQLINILKGDMSIVGPRPERPEIASEYEKTLPEFNLRLQSKCGLTGYAQVYGKYNTTPYDKLQMDLMYLSQPSLVQDLAIMLATIKILFMKESTEGVSEDKKVDESKVYEKREDNRKLTPMSYSK